jgi:hypothetical protein
MNRTDLPPEPPERPFYYLTLACNHKRSQGWISVETLLPGHINPTRATWEAPAGILDASQVEDLVAYVAKRVTEAIVAWGGVQGLLSL